MPPRRALTLIELLVVIIILTTIVAAAIPLMAPANDDRRLREATRGLNTYITGAQARAISLGRPYGVALKRLSADTGRPDDNGVSLEVFYVEQQPPYAGFDRSSRGCVAIVPELRLAIVRFVTSGSPTGFMLPVGLVPDLFPVNTLRPGDIVEINGTRFELLNPAGYSGADQWVNVFVDAQSGFFVPPQSGRSAPTLLARPINDSGQQINPEYDGRGRALRDRPVSPAPQRPFWTAPAPYRVLRQPTFASDEPYQLPEGTAIDLRASGLGAKDYFYVPKMHDNSDHVFVMFAPEGGVYRLSYNQQPLKPEIFDKPVADNVYLLVGKRENVPAISATTDPTLAAGTLTDEQKAELRTQINWLSGSSRWVVIGSQSGRIVTIENALVDPGVVFTLGVAKTPPAPASSEQLRNEQILAAREFTREMAQLGGR